MVERQRVKELRSTSRLQPRAAPVNTYSRPEVDMSSSRKMEQLQGLFDKVAPIAEGAAEAQYKQRERQVEAERTLDNRKSFTDWKNGLDTKLSKLPPDQYGQALDTEFNSFMGQYTDDNDKIMMSEMYGDFYVKSSGQVATKAREEEESRRLGKLSTMLWSTVSDESLSPEERIAGIEEVISFGNSEFGYSREILNDWLVEKQLEIAKYDDANENFVILDWMEATKRVGVGKYQEALNTIRHEKKTRTGLALEVERARVLKEHQTLLESGQLSDEYYSKIIENGTFSATQAESLKADAVTFRKQLESDRLVTEVIDNALTSVTGGNSRAALPVGIQGDVDFINATERTAANLGVPIGWLYSVMAFETGSSFAPDELNRAGSGATGLIQFMPDTAIGMGTTVEALSKMSRGEQMEYVQKYLEPYKELINSPDDLYMAIIYPKGLTSQDSDVFGRDGTKIYSQNGMFDTDKDGVITFGEIRNIFNQSSHVQKFVAFGGNSMGTMSIPSGGMKLPNGKTVSQKDIQDKIMSQYAARSAAIASSTQETTQQTIIREINEFWGNSGSALVNPQWKRALETGFNHAMGNLGDGAIPAETSKMAMELFTQMQARAPHLLKAYMNEEQRSFYEASAFYRDELKQEPDAAMLFARQAQERNANAGNAENRKEEMREITEKYLTNDDGWWITKFGQTDVYNQPEIASKIAGMFDRLLSHGMNTEEAGKIVTRRMEEDYKQVGSSMIDVSHKAIQIYGTDKLAADLEMTMEYFTELDPDYVKYLKTQGDGASDLQLVQDPRFKTRFFFRDGNGNALPPILEDGEVKTGILVLDLFQIDQLSKEARTEKILKDQEAKRPTGETTSMEVPVEDRADEIRNLYKDGSLSEDEQNRMIEKYGSLWNFGDDGRPLLSPTEIEKLREEAQNGN